MSLKKKLFFFIMGLCLAYSLLFLLIDHFTLSHSRDKQKTVFAQKVASRMFKIIENEEKRIATLCYDWAVWDAMYAYVESPYREFEEESLPQSVVPESDLSLVLVLNREGRVIFHQGYDQTSRRFVQFALQDASPPCLWNCLQESSSSQRMEIFIAETKFGPLIVISAPILHSDGKGPMNGRVVMGRLADDSFRQRIAAAIQERTMLLTPVEAQRDLAHGKWRPLEGSDSFFKEGKTSLLVYGRFRNKAGQPVFGIRIDADKTLFALQQQAMRNFLVAILLCTVLIGFTFYRFVDRMLLRRMTDISKKAKHIASLEDLSVRIRDDRHDEISQLGHDINRMLERLENENIRHQEMERRLVLNEKLAATGRLAADIAHEVNNPLFAIANSIAVIKKQIPESAGDIGEVLQLAEKEIARVRKITRKLLDYGKINLETFRESDLESILDTACDVLQLSGQIGQTVITRVGRSGEKPVPCNPDSLQQVFMNLIVNASEAMAGSGEVAIGVERRADAYEVHFQDIGPGFPDETRKRIFEPFNSSKDAKGAGLGLYISYHIVKRHGGGIAFAEASPVLSTAACGTGTHLVVTLPLRGGGKDA
jgi:signal transduction histidine kinase